MESRKNDAVRCKSLSCKELLCHTSDCYIFKEKVSKQVHFALATRENVILHRTYNKKFKTFQVTCKQGHKIGAVNCIGYQDAEVICLSLKDLVIGDDQFKKVDDLVKVEQSYVWKVVEDMVIDQVKAVESCYRRTNFPNGHVELPNDIKLEYEPFDYQIECFHHIMNVLNSHKKNSVIFLETGTAVVALNIGRGKTLISVLTAAKMLELNPDKRILMIVPTVSLVCQQVKIFKTWLPNGHAICCGIFGEMSQTKKAAFCLDEKMRVFVTTAGSFNNLTLKTCTENEGCSDDCLHKLLHIGQFSLLILDESHHCFKNSPYNDVIRAYDQCKPEFRPMILGLTASPIVGSISNPDENIRSYLGNFNASIFYPFYRDILNDSDWAFKKRFNFQFEEFKVDKKEILFRDTLIKMIKDILASISMPLNDGRDWNLNLIRAEINVLLSQEEYGNKHKLVRYCIKMLNCLDSIATDYLCEVVETVKLHHKLIEAKDKILWNQLNLVASFKNYLALLDSLEAHLEGSRSKVDLLKDVLLRHTDRLSKTIVFFQRRKDCRKLKDILSKDLEFSKYNPEYVIGQGFGDGMTNFQVQRCLNDFKSGECRLLLATDILEEGIDVPECNVVIRYDLSKTVKSFIQSRGRARKENSKFIVLTESIEQTKKLLQDEKEMLRAICERTMEDVEERKDDSSLRRLMSQVERLKINAIESIKNIFVEMCSSKSKEEISKILKKHIGNIECSSQKDGLYWIAFELKDSKSCDIYENILQIQFNDPKVKLRPIEPIKSAKIELSCGSLCHGYFQDDNNFVICDEILEKFSLEVNFDSRNSFLKFVAEDKILMKCSFLSLKNEISISQRPDETLVIFSLHSAPDFYIHDSDLKQTYVDMRFKPLTFCFKVDMESSCDLWTFRTIFSSGTLKCYDKIISFHQQDNQIKKKYLKLDFEREYFLWSLLTDKFSHLGLSRNLIEVISEIDDVNEFYIPRDTTVNTVSGLITLIKTPRKLEKRELKNYLWVKRIIITPCRFVFTGEDAISSNRVFRLLSNKVDDFIDCNIRYEDFSEHLVWQVEPFLPVLKTILLKGIKVGDKVFKFFAASNSQQRNGGLYLTNLDQNSLYSTLGDFSSLPNAAKTMSRIGLSLGSSLATISITFNKNMMIDDVKNDKYCFTDGIGMISPDLASEITKLMGLEKCPSAFQIRYAGFKGVLAVNPNAKGILFRPSMKKFESKYSHIDVLNYSKPQNLTLNRQSIAILSHLGISDETFEMIHDDHLFSLIDSFNDPHTAHCLLKEHLSHHLLDVSLIKSKCNFLFDPFFQKMLHNLVLYQINSLKTKACIPVEKGRNMIGVVDEYDILDYGKVFVQYTDDNENCEIVKGKVVVYRCPLSRASDVLVLEAIDVPELRHLKDVIVFPRKGVRPHPHECSGGDLDGDLYSVIWEEKLIPAESKEFVDIECPVIEQVRESTSIETMCQRFIDIKATNRLGIASHALQAIWDHEGVESEKARYLAAFIFYHIDAVKTNIDAKFNSYAKPKAYPHFMETKNNYYLSKNILGKLYDKCSDLVMEDAETNPKKYDLFILEGYEKFLKEAEELYKEYELSLSQELDRYGLNEYEFLSGAIRRIPDKITERTETFVLKIRETSKKLIEDYRKRIIKDPAFVSACYFVGLREKYESFAWIEYETLINSIQVQNVNLTMEDKINSSLRKYLDSKGDLLDKLDQRICMGERLIKIINSVCDNRVKYSGSTATLLFSDNSDIDLIVCEADKDLMIRIYEEIRKTYNEAELIPHEHVFTIRGDFFDITNNDNGKTEKLLCLFLNHQELYPILFFFIDWLRSIGYINSTERSNGLFLTTEAIWFFNDVLKKIGYLNNSFLFYVKSSLFGGIKPSDINCEGKEIYKFWASQLPIVKEKLKNSNLSAQYLWKFLKSLSRKSPGGIEQSWSSFIQICIKALYLFSVSDGDLFSFLSKFHTSLCLPINGLLASRFSSHEEYHKKYLYAKFNIPSTVNIEFKSINTKLFLMASGDPVSLENIKREIEFLNYYAVIMRKRNENSYFIENSSFILVEGSNDFKNDRLVFVPLHNFPDMKNIRLHPEHYGLPQHFIRLLQSVCKKNWKEDAFDRFFKRFKEQIEMFTCAIKNKHEHERLIGPLTALIRVGYHYLLKIKEEECQFLSVTELEDLFQLGLNPREQNEDESDEGSGESGSEDLSLEFGSPEKSVAKLNENFDEVNSKVTHSFFTIARKDPVEHYLRKGFQLTSTINKISITIESADRDFNIDLDENYNFVCIEHRAVRWFCSTLTAFDDAQKERSEILNDVRFYLNCQNTCKNDPLAKKIANVFISNPPKDYDDIFSIQEFKKLNVSVRNVRIQSQSTYDAINGSVVLIKTGVENIYSEALRKAIPDLDQKPRIEIDLRFNNKCIEDLYEGEVAESSVLEDFARKFFESGLELMELMNK